MNCFVRIVAFVAMMASFGGGAVERAVAIGAFPDFSTVGYHHGDRALPRLPVVKRLSAPVDGADAGGLIQAAIDAMTGPGAIFLEAGTYHIEGTIRLNRPGVVLRGAGATTVFLATARRQQTLIRMGGEKGCLRNERTAVDIVTPVPVGQMWVEATGEVPFKAGARVCVFRPGTQNWIHDLGMDRIPPRKDGRKVSQWRPKGYMLSWEREVRAVKGRRIFLDAPIMMALEAQYGGGRLIACTSARVTECGVEDLVCDSVYDATQRDKKGNFIDERHGWTAIDVRNAENCWVRKVTSRHFGFALVGLNGGARLCTVADCRVCEPVSQVTGGRRYGFNITGGEMCLVRDSSVDYDRHGFVTNHGTPGPNVFLRCTGTHMQADIGPHQRWATGCLYDGVRTDGALNIQNRSNMGTGHGWAGANFILWNCTASSLICHSPPVSGKNAAIGCVGRANQGRSATAGEWISPGRPVMPKSLYEAQRQARK